MIARPATPDYGRLSVMLQAIFRVTRLFTVPPGAFRPVPNVDSAVARLVPLGAAKHRIDDAALFGRVVAAAFGQRRKTLRNALSALCDASALEAAGIDPSARGETLAVADFVRLANALAGRKRVAESETRKGGGEG
jgi:16S rRNA (adenine1518-N6/adenine1519-N6)-dimethyltransferase